MDHKETRHNHAEMTEHKVLKTIEHVLENAGERLTLDEVEKLDHCWNTIKNIYASMTYAKQAG